MKPQEDAGSASADTGAPSPSTSTEHAPEQLAATSEQLSNTSTEEGEEEAGAEGGKLRSGVSAQEAGRLSGAARRRKAEERRKAGTSPSPPRVDRAQQDAAIEGQLATKAAKGDVQAARTLMDWRGRGSGGVVQGDAWLDLLTPEERGTVSALIARAEARARGEEPDDEADDPHPPAGRDSGGGTLGDSQSR